MNKKMITFLCSILVSNATFAAPRVSKSPLSEDVTRTIATLKKEISSIKENDWEKLDLSYEVVEQQIQLIRNLRNKMIDKIDAVAPKAKVLADAMNLYEALLNIGYRASYKIEKRTKRFIQDIFKPLIKNLYNEIIAEGTPHKETLSTNQNFMLNLIVAGALEKDTGLIGENSWEKLDLSCETLERQIQLIRNLRRQMVEKIDAGTPKAEVLANAIDLYEALLKIGYDASCKIEKRTQNFTQKKFKSLIRDVYNEMRKEGTSHRKILRGIPAKSQRKRLGLILNGIGA